LRKGPARLSIHNLEGLVAEDDVDTVLVAFTDMQGRLQGKRFRCEALPLRDRRPRHRGVCLPARRRRGHEHGAGLRHVIVGNRIRGLRHAARSCNAAAHALAPEDRRVPGGSALGRRHARGRRTPTDPAGTGKPARRARLDRPGGHRARVSSSSRTPTRMPGTADIAG